MSESQAVVDQTNGEAQPSPQDAGGAPEPTLDDLLKEFEQPSTEAKPDADKPKETEAKPADETKEILDYVRAKRTEEVTQKTQGDIANAVKTVKGELDGLPVTDRIVRGVLHDLAASDQRFLTAFQNRDKNPKAWENVLKGVAKDLRKEFDSLPDRNVSEDRDAVRAAIRGASTTAPASEGVDNRKLNQMSDAEFRRWKESLA